MLNFIRKKAIGFTATAFSLMAMVLVMGAPAYALNVDQNRIVSARVYPYQMVHYYRLTVNYNDPRISTGQLFGSLPKNAYILSIDADVTTAFNAVTTNVLTIGATSANANEISASGTLAPGTLGIQHLTTAAGLGVAVTGNPTYQNSNGDVGLYVKYTQTGTAATAGSVTIVIAYVPNNDM